MSIHLALEWNVLTPACALPLTSYATTCAMHKNRSLVNHAFTGCLVRWTCVGDNADINRHAPHAHTHDTDIAHSQKTLSHTHEGTSVDKQPGLSARRLCLHNTCRMPKDAAATCSRPTGAWLNMSDF